MKNGKDIRLAMIPTGQIRRMPELRDGGTRAKVEKAREFVKNRGHCIPVMVSDSGGEMSLLSGAAAFNACLEEKRPKVPAVIVHTEGGADDLLFALQSSGLDTSLDAISASAAVVHMIDAYGVTRKHIAQSLGKSAAWVNKMESLSRKLNSAVRDMVAQGGVPPRTAQEIARLPDNVQAPFAISVRNEFLSKGSVAQLVSMYLDEASGPDERDRIINTPRLALPAEWKSRGRKNTGRPGGTLLPRAMARCFDSVSYLSGLLNFGVVDTGGIRASDAAALAGSLADLSLRVRAVFYPGKNGAVDPSATGKSGAGL